MEISTQKKHSSEIKKKLLRTTGIGLVALGLIFVVDVIGRFVIGIAPSQLLNELTNYSIPVIRNSLENLASMNIAIKAGGGSSLIALGSLMLKKSS